MTLCLAGIMVIPGSNSAVIDALVQLAAVLLTPRHTGSMRARTQVRSRSKPCGTVSIAGAVAVQVSGATDKSVLEAAIIDKTLCSFVSAENGVVVCFSAIRLTALNHCEIDRSWLDARHEARYHYTVGRFW
jgi:hypothetical protein